MPGISLSLLR